MRTCLPLPAAEPQRGRTFDSRPAFTNVPASRRRCPLLMTGQPNQRGTSRTVAVRASGLLMLLTAEG